MKPSTLTGWGLHCIHERHTMRTLTITTDQTDANGDYLIHEHLVSESVANRVLTQCNTRVEYLTFTATDGDRAVRLMDVHSVSVE